MSASSLGRIKKGERDRGEGLWLGGGFRDIRGQKICVCESRRKREWGGERWWKWVKKGEKITRIHPLLSVVSLLSWGSESVSFFQGLHKWISPSPLLLSCSDACYPLNTDTYWSHGWRRKNLLSFFICDSHLHLKPPWPRNRKSGVAPEGWRTEKKQDVQTGLISFNLFW